MSECEVSGLLARRDLALKAIAPGRRVADHMWIMYCAISSCAELFPDFIRGVVRFEVTGAVDRLFERPKLI